MELSKQQIETLFQFTQKKYVHWYDLQVELVDHLATRIEEAMEADPKLPFETALANVYSGFGLFGFAHIVQQKQKGLERQSRKLWWQAFLSFFAWPKILPVAGATYASWLVSGLPAISLVFVFAAFIFSEIRMWWARRRNRTAARRLLLLEVSPLTYASGVFYFQIYFFSNHFDGTAAFAFCLITLISVLINLASEKAFKTVYDQALRDYPEAFEMAPNA